MDIMTASATCLKLSKRSEIWKLTAQETKELADARKFLQEFMHRKSGTMKVFDPCGMMK